MSLRQHYWVYFAAFALLPLSVCGTASAQTGGAPGAESATAPGDESYTAAEYARLGLPAADEVWSDDDMVKAHEVLAALAQTGYEYLPRYKSKRSGKVFARLTSRENLKPWKIRSVPLQTRLPQSLTYFQASNGIFELYLAAAAEKAVGESELVELMGSHFRVAAVVMDLVDELLPSFDKDDPSYLARMAGLEQMKQGLASIVGGGLQTLTERNSYSGGELARLVGYMQESYPLIVPRLLPSDRAETLSRLEELQDEPALQDLQPGLGHLQEKVKAALQTAEDSEP